MRFACWLDGLIWCMLEVNAVKLTGGGSKGAVGVNLMSPEASNRFVGKDFSDILLN